VVRRVREGVADRRRTRRVPARRAVAAVCAALAVAVVVTLSIPGASTFAQDVLRSWGFTINGGNASVEMGGAYVELRGAGRNMTPANYSSIDEIEEMLGVDILESPDAYTGAEGLYKYHPAVKDGELYSASITNGVYAVGDLENLRVENDTDDWSSLPTTRFDRGERYASAISCQIAVRGARAEDTEDTEYEQGPWDMEDVEITTYRPAQIDSEAAIYTILMDMKMDGMDSEDFGGGEEPATFAQFAYGGASYIYIGRVPVDEMKVFLDTLAPER
jgi:hypothetical protein